MITGETYTVHIGSNLDVLPTLEDNSIDSIVTDPPYEISFMSKSWDGSGIAYSVELWKECLRILKPGGHLLSFGGTRTWHRVAVAIEDAGFEVRDSIAWMYGSGFPKSLDVSKAIDKAAGAEREVVGVSQARVGVFSHSGSGIPQDIDHYGENRNITAPSTPEAKQWEGWGTALKPAFEPIVVARKPLIGTVAENVLTHGTGALNIDGSRIGTEERTDTITENGFGSNFMDDNWQPSGKSYQKTVQGRWPANVILDEYSAEILDEQSGVSVSKSGGKSGTHPSPMDWGKENSETPRGGFDDKGGASRFFYVAKASKRDRNEGLEDLEATSAAKMVDRKEGSSGMDNPRAEAGRTSGAKNFHPTVKPTDLMRYLVKLVTPPNGTVLDPFTGSGSTGKAAILEGFRFVGIELTEDYIPIIEGRLKHAEATLGATQDQEKEKLF